MESANKISVAYIGDERIIDPLVVSVFTLVSFLAKGYSVDLHILQQGWKEKHKDDFENKMANFSDCLNIIYHQINLTPYSALPSFHGSKHCYALLHITLYVKSPRIIYIDYDTLPLLDISELFAFDLKGHACGAVGWNMTASSSQESFFFDKVGIAADTPVFNSGVMLIDRNIWESNKVTEKCMKIAGDAIEDVVGDQTLLNAAINGNFAQLPWRFNVRLGAMASKYDGNGLVHFVGGPKPWDLLGRWRHKNFRLWNKWRKSSKQFFNKN